MDQRYKKILIIVCLSFIIFIFLPTLWWLLDKPRSISVLTVDKTVPCLSISGKG
jgi:hypothetical protein